MAAAFGLNRENRTKAWRCYPVSELTPDRRHFVPDSERPEDHICSRSAQLEAVQHDCGKSLPEPPCPSRPSPPTPAPAGPPKLLPGVAFITKVFIGGTDGCVMYRTPSLLNVGNGVLLAFTQCRQVSHGDASPQEIHMKTSDDNGRSWGPTSVLPFSADPLHNSLHRAQTIFDSTTGAVFIFDDALAYPTTKHNNSHPCTISIWRTDDLGKHWRSVRNMSEPGYTGSGLATGVQLPSGKLVLAARAGCNSHKSDAGAHALWSDDNGGTWVAGKPTQPNVNECQLAPLMNGSLIMNARTGSTDRLSLLSTDEGQSKLSRVSSLPVVPLTTCAWFAEQAGRRRAGCPS